MPVKENRALTKRVFEALSKGDLTVLEEIVLGRIRTAGKDGSLWKSRRPILLLDAWGTWGPKTRGRVTVEGIIRSSFLVDEEGKIERAWYGVTPEDTVPNALAALSS